MRSLKSTASTTEVVVTGDQSASAPAAVAAVAMQRSPWHSPVPYLFGGLAAMLGLIAFALLILACSYWKLSGQMSNEDGNHDLESGDDEMKKKGDGKGKGRVVYEEQFVVILAGDDKPTCLATPVTSRVMCFVTDGGDGGGDKSEKAESCKEELEAAEKRDEESNTRSEQSHDERSEGLHLHDAETSSS